MGLYDAVAHFNIGTFAILKLFKARGIPVGKFTEAGCHQQDQSRAHLAQRKSLDGHKKENKSTEGPPKEER